MDHIFNTHTSYSTSLKLLCCETGDREHFFLPPVIVEPNISDFNQGAILKENKSISYISLFKNNLIRIRHWKPSSNDPFQCSP